MKKTLMYIGQVVRRDVEWWWCRQEWIPEREALMERYVCHYVGHKFTRKKMYDTLCERCYICKPHE